MKAFIVEDEPMARMVLIRALEENCPDVEVVGSAGSVREAVSWLGAGNPDIVFMDVELSDGKCFEIFRQVAVKAKVIMTTAYESYAVKAFEVNSIDYLLKPIEPSALVRAVGRCRENKSLMDMEALMAALGQIGTTPARTWRERFLVQLGERIVPVGISDIAYFFSDGGDNHLVTREGTVYIVDSTIDAITAELDPSRFFRISRGGIVAKDSVSSVSKLLGGRLRVTPSCPAPKMYSPDLTVSRSRSEAFIAWLGE